jgi:hypothetical protein
MIVAAPMGRSVQAADMPVVKAAPVDYVERCTQYGNGWIRYPGTAYCIKLAAKTGFDIDVGQRKDVLVLQQDNSKDSHYTQTLVPKAQQDQFGIGVGSVNFGAQTRTQTSYGTLSSSAQFAFGQTSGLDGANSKAPAANLGPGDGQTFKNSNTIFGGNIGFSWGPLGNISVGRFTSEYVYMGKNDISFGYGIPSVRTNHVLYQWNSSGSNNDPVGWTLNVAAEDPAGHSDGGQWGIKSKGLDGNPCAVGGVGVEPGTTVTTACNGFGGVSVTRGPFRFPDIIPNIRWLDDDIGSAFAAFAIHSIDRQVIASSPNNAAFGLGGACTGPGVPAGILLGSCTNGQVVHSMGWGNLYALHLNLPKVAGNAPFARDYILTEFTFSNGAMQEGGFHPSAHVRGGTPPFTEGGLLTDDGDAIAVALPGGGVMLEKEKFALWNWDYRHYLTDCTDPDWCWNMHLSGNLGWIRPGVIARNTDWTKGGVGNAFVQYYEFGIHYGVAELNMEVEVDVAYMHHNQDLAHDPGVGPTALPAGIKPNDGSWVGQITFARNFGGALGKALSGF